MPNAEAVEIVAEANTLGITPEQAIVLKASAAASGITLAEAAALVAPKAAPASAPNEHSPLAFATRAAIAAIASYVSRAGDDSEACTAIVHSVSGWSGLQADDFISEYGKRLQTIAQEVRAITKAADESSRRQSSKVMKRE